MCPFLSSMSILQNYCTWESYYFVERCALPFLEQAETPGLFSNATENLRLSRSQH